MADSSTDATPSTISPSPGMSSPAETKHRSPRAAWRWEFLRSLPFAETRFAMVSERALRSVSACALPRPSAMASAKLANSTVNHSHSVICRLKRNASCGCRISSTVVITLPISTTNMTGLPIMLRGLSLSSELHDGAANDLPSQIDLRWLAIDLPRKSSPRASAGAQESVPGSAPGRMSARRQSG